MKLLIAYDGSSCADQALDDLQRAGLPDKVEAVVVSVADVLLVPGSGTSASPLPESPSQAAARKALDEARQMALEASARVQAMFPRWTVRGEAFADSPAWAIIKQADQWQPNLVVVGSHGRSALARLVLGSVSQKVLHEARSSVRIARDGGGRPDSPLRLLIGVDGSPDGEAAVAAVAARSWPSGTEARVIMAIDLLASTALELGGDFGEDDETRTKRMIHVQAKKLGDAGLAVSTDLMHGDAKHVLLDEAEKWKADSVFVGTRGIRRIERFLLGSVAATVAARAHCSVEVVRTAASSTTASRIGDR